MRYLPNLYMKPWDCFAKTDNGQQENVAFERMQSSMPVKTLDCAEKGHMSFVKEQRATLRVKTKKQKRRFDEEESLISNRTHWTIQRSLKAQSCTLSWRKRASRAGSLRIRSSCSLSSDREKSSGPSPHPPSWGWLGYPGCTISSAVSRGSSVPGRLEGVPDCLAVKECLRAFWRLGMDMCWPTVVNPRYASGHLWKELSWGAQC